MDKQDIYNLDNPPYICPICGSDESKKSRLGAIEMCDWCSDEPDRVIELLLNRIKGIRK